MSDGGSKKDDPKKSAQPVQRSRLNAELAHQFSYQHTGRAPGRKNRLDEEELAEAPVLDEEEAAPEQASAEHADPQAAEREPKKSVFELPRKEPTRQPLPGSPFTPASAGTTAANTDAPAAPPPASKPKPKP
jgi:hypothetical protein